MTTSARRPHHRRILDTEFVPGPELLHETGRGVHLVADGLDTLLEPIQPLPGGDRTVLELLASVCIGGLVGNLGRKSGIDGLELYVDRVGNTHALDAEVL